MKVRFPIQSDVHKAHRGKELNERGRERNDLSVHLGIKTLLRGENNTGFQITVLVHLIFKNLFQGRTN